MAIVRTFSGQVVVTMSGTLTHSSSSDATGSTTYQLSETISLTDGTGNNAGTAAIKGTLTVGTSNITLSLADDVDPFSTAGDAVPSGDPEGKELLGCLFINDHASAIVTVRVPASTGILGVMETLGDGVKIGPNKGAFLWYSPGGNVATGGSTLVDGTRDEMQIVSDTANTTVRCIVLYQ
jgi:hypothetical protein